MEKDEKKVNEEELEDEDEELDEDADLDEEDIDENLDGDDEDETSKDKKDETKKVQTKEERAHFAKMRREREAKEREAREKDIREKALLEGELNATKVNTFTNKPIKDEYDLKVFKLQQEIESEGGDPLADLPERLAKLDRENASKVKKENDAKKEQDEIISNDIKEFRTKYPKVNLSELLKDPDFKDYSDGRLGVKGGLSLVQIYENFNKFMEKYKKTEKKEEEDDGKTPPPSPNGGRKQEQTSYSKMTREQRIEYLKKQGLINNR